MKQNNIKPKPRRTFLSRCRHTSLRSALWLLTTAGLLISSPASATITIYTSSTDWDAAVSSIDYDSFGMPLPANTTLSNPLSRTTMLYGTYGYDISASAGSNLHVVTPGPAYNFLAADSSAGAITFNNFTGGVTSFGGLFFNTSSNGYVSAGNITLTATDADGSVSETVSVMTLADGWVGFVSTGALSSVVLSTTEDGKYVTTSSVRMAGPSTPGAKQSFTYSSPAESINARPNVTVDLNGTLSNTAESGASDLNISLSSTGFLSVTDLSATSGTVAAGGSTEVTGTINTGGLAGAQDWQVVNNDPTATNTNVNISGTVNVYDYAQAKYSGTTLDFGHIHQGGTAAAQTVAIGNQAVSSVSYQDLLDVSATTDNALVTATGFTGLAASADGETTQNLSFAVDTSTVGTLASTATLTLTSNANGVEGLSNGTATTVGAPTDITTTGFVYSGQGVWNTDGSGNWSDFSKWTTNGGSPGLDAGFTTTDTATFGDSASSEDPTVTLDAVIASLKAMTFNNSTHSYTVDSIGVGGLVLDGGGAGATVTVSAGSHAISAPVALNDNTEVTVTNQADQLKMSREIYGEGSLTKLGAGVLLLSGTDTYTGSTNVNEGTLALSGSLSGGGDTTVAAGAYLLGNGSITPAEGNSLYLNGGLVVHNMASTSEAGSFSVTGGIVMGESGVIAIDLFSGAGLGDNSGNSSAADQLSLHGTLNASEGGTLLIGNPNTMTGFAGGDHWQVINLNEGAGSITGTLAVNDSALGLSLGFKGAFDASTGIYTIEDHRGELATQGTGLPMANAESQAMITGVQTAISDVNNHLFHLRAGMGEEEAEGSIASAMDDGVIVGEGDGPEERNPMARLVKRSRRWEVFSTVNYGNVRLSPINNQSGVQVDSWASSVGIERHVSRRLMLGFAATYLNSTQTYTGGLGKVDLEGPNLAAYLTYVRKDYWSSLLYSFGDYDLDSTRNPGLGQPVAQGSTNAYTHAVQYNTGWNFRFQNNTLITGPFAGVDYLHGTIDAYNETGGGFAALRFNKQTFQSLVTRVGWSTSKKLETDWAVITPQLRLSYERQNIKNNGTSVQSLTVPISASGGNQTPGQDYMVIGTSVNFQFTPDLSLLLGYQVQVFRNNMTSHFGSVRIGYRF